MNRKPHMPERILDNLDIPETYQCVLLALVFWFIITLGIISCYLQYKIHVIRQELASALLK